MNLVSAAVLFFGVVLPFSFFFLVFSAPFQEGNGAEKTKKKNEKGRTTQKNRTAAKEAKWTSTKLKQQQAVILLNITILIWKPNLF